MNTAENTAVEGTTKELTAETLAAIEIIAPTKPTLSIEEMEFEQALAEERAANLKQSIADAKVQKRAEDLHKIVEILDNLENQFGEDLVNIIKKKYEVTKVIVLSNDKEVDDYEKFLTLVARGYKVVDGEVMGKRNEPLNCNTINSQITNEPKVLMNVPKFKTLYAKYK
jgi:vacuolar-type H+-ATPase subunit E/Vma4